MSVDVGSNHKLEIITEDGDRLDVSKAIVSVGQDFPGIDESYVPIELNYGVFVLAIFNKTKKVADEFSPFLVSGIVYAGSIGLKFKNYALLISDISSSINDVRIANAGLHKQPARMPLHIRSTTPVSEWVRLEEATK